MSDNTPRLGIAELAQMQEMDATTINEAFVRLDAISDVYLLGQYVNTPPASPADGDTYITGGAPTGAWTGYAYKIAYCIDGGWRFFTPFNGLRAFVAPTNGFIAYRDGAWIDSNALISASEASIASAATCDLGTAGSLFVQVTGATAITDLGSGPNLLRFVRFAGALTLTHNATSLVLPGGGNIATAAGDCAIVTSDAGGNWRCRSYQRASGLPVNAATATGTGAMVLATSPTLTTPALGAATGASLALGGATLGSNALAVTGSAAFNGQVGIAMPAATASKSLTSFGTTTAANYWEVVNTSGRMFLGVEGAAGGSIFSGSTGYATVLGSVSGPVQLYANSALVATLATDKSFLVGTTTPGGWNGSSLLAVQQSAASSTAVSAHTTGSGSVAIFSRIDNTNNALVQFNYQTATVGSITTNGSATSYNTSSDRRLKDKLEAQRDFGAIIDALWFGDVAFKADDSRAPYLLCIAQEAAEHFPDAIFTPADPEAMWSADYGKFAPLAMWGVKELRARVAALEARIAALEAKAA